MSAKVIHTGALFGGSVECHVLDDGQRLITQRSALAALRGGDGPEKGDWKRYVAGLPSSYTRLLTDQPIEFPHPKGGRIAHGITPEHFIRVLDAYVDAGLSGKLLPSQRHLAQNARALSKGLTLVGLNALIDEATGYQRVREADRLKRDLELFLRWEASGWQLTWDNGFALRLSRFLRGSRWDGRGKQPAPLAGIYRYIYMCVLGPDVYRHLKERNPVPRERSNHHQYLQDPIARKLRLVDCVRIETIERQSKTLHEFKERLALEYGRDIQTSWAH